MQTAQSVASRDWHLRILYSPQASDLETSTGQTIAMSYVDDNSCVSDTTTTAIIFHISIDVISIVITENGQNGMQKIYMSVVLYSVHMVQLFLPRSLIHFTTNVYNMI